MAGPHMPITAGAHSVRAALVLSCLYVRGPRSLGMARSSFFDEGLERVRILLEGSDASDPPLITVER